MCAIRKSIGSLTGYIVPTSRVAVLAICFIGMRVLTASAQLQQSPIDIRPGNVMLTVLPALHFDYHSGVTLDVVNTGSPSEEATIRANVAGGAGSLTLSGTQYNLEQFHFHEPSEHLYNGHALEMELHMVHRATNGDLLVVGRLIELGAHNSLLNPIFANLPSDTSTHLPVNNFDLSGLLPSSLDSLRYAGSLTTPPFTEGVQWILLTENLELDQNQIDAFHALFHEGNSRPVQPLHGRVVLTDDPAFVPEPSAVVLLVSGIVGVLARRQDAVIETMASSCPDHDRA
jgi:carbonic anhydrase